MAWVLSGCHCYLLSSVFIGKMEGDKRRAQLEKCLALHWALSGLLWSLLCDSAVEHRPGSNFKLSFFHSKTAFSV